MPTNTPQPYASTTQFNPSFAEVVLEAFARCQIRPTSLTIEHMQEANRSANMLMSSWSTKKSWPNLWTIQLNTIPLVPGVATYSIPATTIGLLDMYIRQFEMNAAVSVAPGFTTTLNSTTCQWYFPNHGQAAGNWVESLVQVSVGGVLVFGQYEVVSVLDPNNLTVTLAKPATASVPAGGAVPTFTSSVGSEIVTVVLAAHGLVAGNDFNVPVSTAVGGLTISGMYQVTTYIDANTFTITSDINAASTQTVAENGGLASLQGQNTTVAPFDRVIYPISRTEYASYPNKQDAGFPSVAWFFRSLTPTLTLWLVPDSNGPYTLFWYSFQQTADVVTSGGTTLQLPWRFLDAFSAGLAAKLAWKYPPPPASGINVSMLEQEAQRAWDDASAQDSEDVPLYIVPGLTGYYR